MASTEARSIQSIRDGSRLAASTSILRTLTSSPPGSGSGAGIANFSPLHVTVAEADLADVMRSVAEGDIFKGIRIEGLAIGKTQAEVYELTLADVVLTKVVETEAGFFDLALDYSKLSLVTSGLRADGATTKNGEFAFDLAKHQEITPFSLNLSPGGTTPSNRAPVANPLTVSTDEDVAVPLILAGSDADGDNLIFRVVNGPSHGTLSGSGANLTYTPADNYNGPDSFTYVANDGSVDSGAATVSLTISAVNDVPVVDAGGDQTIDEGSAATLAASFVDPDPDTHTVVVDWGDGSATGSSLDDTHVYADDGIYTITVAVTDDDGGTDSDTRTVTVNNVAPVVDAGGDQTIDEGSAATLAASFVDPGADTHTVVVDWGDGSATGSSLDDTHVYADDGIYTITVAVTDDDGGTDSDTRTVTVNNVAPVVDAGGDQTIDEGSAATLAASFVDPGADTHTVVVDWGDGSATGSSLDDTHVYADDGIYTITVAVTDDDGGTDSDTRTVTVNNVAPVAGADTATVLEDNGVEIDVLANDTDMGAFDALSITSLSGTKSTLGASISVMNGKIHYTADADMFDLLQSGQNLTDNFIYTISDGDGGTSTATVTVLVNGVSSQTIFLGNGADTFSDVGEADSIIYGQNGADAITGTGGQMPSTAVMVLTP